MFNGNFSDQLNKRNKNNSLKDIVFNRGVERETLRVSRFLLLIPIIDFSNDNADSASLELWTSTKVAISRSFAAW